MRHRFFALEQSGELDLHEKVDSLGWSHVWARSINVDVPTFRPHVRLSGPIAKSASISIELLCRT